MKKHLISKREILHQLIQPTRNQFPMSLVSPALAGRFFATAPPGKPKAASEHPTTPALVSFPGPP